MPDGSKLPLAERDDSGTIDPSSTRTAAARQYSCIAPFSWCLFRCGVRERLFDRLGCTEIYSGSESVAKGLTIYQLSPSRPATPERSSVAGHRTFSTRVTIVTQQTSPYITIVRVRLSTYRVLVTALARGPKAQRRSWRRSRQRVELPQSAERGSPGAEPVAVPAARLRNSLRGSRKRRCRAASWRSFLPPVLQPAGYHEGRAGRRSREHCRGDGYQKRSSCVVRTLARSS